MGVRPALYPYIINIQNYVSCTEYLQGKITDDRVVDDLGGKTVVRFPVKRISETDLLNLYKYFLPSGIQPRNLWHRSRDI